MAMTFSVPNLQAYMQSVGEALRANNMTRACSIAAEAVSRGFSNVQLLTLAAYEHLNRGNAILALDLAQKARDASPRSIDALTVLAQCLAKLGKTSEAIKTYDVILKQAPLSLPQRFSKACLLEDTGDVAPARKEFERILDAAPNHSGTLSSLATLAAQGGDTESARDYANRALKSDPDDFAAVLALGSCDVQQGKFEDAILRLSRKSSNESATNRAIAQGLVGDGLDGLGRTDEAFQAYEISQSILRDLHRLRFEVDGKAAAQAHVEQLTGYFQSAPAAAWRADKTADYASRYKTHVFLVGFPRSGTTLLEQILASHPNVVTMEERDCLIGAANEFLTTADGLEKLSSLATAKLESFREDYWHLAEGYGVPPEGNTFVDKMPLNTNMLALIAKMFPRAKILFALRDPRDVVLSCFRRRFGMSAQMYMFTSLQSAASYYDAVMRLGEIYRGMLGLPLFDLRYELVVEDFEIQVQEVCKFLGLHWDVAMQDFSAHAKKRAIKTPSAAQVVRGLYKHGVDQWRRYEKQLAPVMPLLDPWVARFGY